MKLRFKAANFLYNILVLAVVFTLCGFAPSTVAMASAGGALVTGTALSFVPRVGSLAFMAVQKEIWSNDIEEQIFKDNTFVRLSFKADSYVNGRAVHIPQSGGAGAVVKNRTSLPANVRKRTDSDVIYLIDEFTTDPVLISNADTVELSYDKRNSVIGEDKNKLSQTIAEEMIYNWLHNQPDNAPLPASSFVYTTGPTVAATAPGATGTRKSAALNDLQKLRTLFAKQNRWFNGQMNGLLTPDMQVTMFPADSLTTATYMQSTTEDERRNGIILKAQGFGLMERSTVVVVAADGTIKAPGAAAAAGDCNASLFWYTLAVETAYGDVKMFDQIGAPEYYGDLYSFLCRMGGRPRRADFLGIALLVETSVTV